MNRRQQVIAAIVYFFFGILIFLIFMRFTFLFFNAPASNPFFGFFYGLSNFFTSPFEGIYPSFNVGPFNISVSTFIAMVFYSLFAYLIALLFSSFADLNPLRIVRNLIRFVFRVIETILFTRFFLRALAASQASGFVRFIYDLTNGAIAPIGTVIPTLDLGPFAIEFSTLLVLGIIIFLDIMFENLFAGIFGEDDN